MTLRYNFPREAFPITIEALHPDTKQVVWSTVVEMPEDAQPICIPPLKRQLGHPVEIRVTFADGAQI